MIQNIETTYRGYRFRSRTEARWAVFFDYLGWKWEYEKEGYVLEDGTRYLPDFWFPELKVFAEVKGKEFTEEEKRKCQLLSKLHDVILLDGPPDEKGYDIYRHYKDEFYFDDIKFMPPGSKYGPFFLDGGQTFNGDFGEYYTEQYEAVLASRSARFEFNH